MSNELVVVDAAPVSARALQQQVNAIQHAMEQVMKDGIHFGKVPGCGDKPALLKPGAEKIGLMFRLIPTFQINRTDLQNGHREYEVICTLNSPDGKTMGQGLGNCSTMESKYRYRGNAVELTETPVPKDYWKERNAEILIKAMGGGFEAKQLQTKKDANNQWVIAIKGERAANPDIADTYNTVLKMAKKRAHVDAILTTTAASDIFTQDIDETADQPAKPEASPMPTQKAKGPKMTKPHWYRVPDITPDQESFMRTVGCKRLSTTEYWMSPKNLGPKLDSFKTDSPLLPGEDVDLETGELIDVKGIPEDDKPSWID